MKKPVIVERFSDNGAHSHWDLINADTGEILWSEQSYDMSHDDNVMNYYVCNGKNSLHKDNLCKREEQM